MTELLGRNGGFPHLQILHKFLILKPEEISICTVLKLPPVFLLPPLGGTTQMHGEQRLWGQSSCKGPLRFPIRYGALDQVLNYVSFL